MSKPSMAMVAASVLLDRNREVLFLELSFLPEESVPGGSVSNPLLFLPYLLM